MASRPSCVGSLGFDPAERAENCDALKEVEGLLDEGDFQGAVTRYFNLPADDDYTYHALASVRLAEAQHALSLGGKNGLLDWYHDAAGSLVSFLI
jgi:hypothetical protein